MANSQARLLPPSHVPGKSKTTASTWALPSPATCAAPPRPTSEGLTGPSVHMLTGGVCTLQENPPEAGTKSHVL